MLRFFVTGLTLLRAINHMEGRLMAALDTLTSEVAEATTVMSSAVTLLAGLKTALDEAIVKLEAGDNGVAIEALSATLDTSANDLAAAVAANTPAAEEVPPVDPIDTGEGSPALSPTGARLRR